MLSRSRRESGVGSAGWSAAATRALKFPVPGDERLADNLAARIAEAERGGWPSEVEGLKTSLADA